MKYENTVLSLNPDRQTLLGQESALREVGFNVIPVFSPVEARFEIEMGRCGLFLISHIIAPAICRDLVGLFRRSCPRGIVVFLMKDAQGSFPAADILVLEREEPRAVVQQIVARQAKKAS